MPTVSVPGATLAFEIQGSGPAVVFVQGVGLTGRGWSPQVSELAANHTCVVFDNRGIGGSSGELGSLSVDQMAQDTVGLLDALALERAHVVGHSLGGVIAQRLALSHPERVASLTLMCTFAGGHDLRRPTARLIWLGMRSQLGTKQMRREAFARLVMPDAYIATHGIAVVVDELEAAFGRNLAAPPAITSRQLSALRAHDERSRLGDLRSIPSLVMSGRFDPIAPPQFGSTLASGIGNARFMEWPEASHALPIQQASAVNRVLQDHFASATPAVDA